MEHVDMRKGCIGFYTPSGQWIPGTLLDGSQDPKENEHLWAGYKRFAIVMAIHRRRVVPPLPIRFRPWLLRDVIGLPLALLCWPICAMRFSAHRLGLLRRVWGGCAERGMRYFGWTL